MGIQTHGQIDQLPIDMDNIRKEKRRYLTFCVAPFLGLLFVGHYKDVWPTMVALYATLAIASILLMNWRFAGSLGYNKWQSALITVLAAMWPIIPMGILLLYKYPKVTGIKLNIFLGDKAPTQD